MFWGDKIVSQIKDRYKDKIASGEPLVVRDEKTASGRVHVGSMRGVAIHGTLSELLTEAGINHTFLYEINDYDPMDGLPVYLDEATFLPHRGKPLVDVPSPDASAPNYPEYFANEFIGVIKDTGFNPTFYRSSPLYKEGKFNEAIRLVLVHANKVREIYKRISGAVKADNWLPVSVICPNCGKVGTTKAFDFDGETVAFECGDFVKWAKGCGSTGRVSPFDGHAKLPWKLEWPAKFFVMKVDIEGGGKDHSTRGGAREIADAIAREVFGIEPPLNIPYEFFQVGGKKMSSSKGSGSSAREIADLLPPHIFRLLLIQKEPQRVIEFMPDGDTVPILFDNYDTYSKKYFEGVEDDFTRILRFAHTPSEREHMVKRLLPRFSTVAFLVQMPHIDPATEFEKLENVVLTDIDRKELELRIKYARIWLSTCAPEDYKSEIQTALPEVAKDFSSVQKAALSSLLSYIKENTLDGQLLHTKLHEIKAETGIEPKDFFSAIYLSVLGKRSGPKAGWFLSVLDKEFLVKRLEEVI